MYLSKDHYMLDVEKKELYLLDKKVAEGDKALDWAFELSPPSEWNSSNTKPFLMDMGLEEFENWGIDI